MPFTERPPNMEKKLATVTCRGCGPVAQDYMQAIGVYRQLQDRKRRAMYEYEILPDKVTNHVLQRTLSDNTNV